MPRGPKLYRPYIPVLTRVLVARRQLRELGVELTKHRAVSLSVHLVDCLERLKYLLNVEALELDHDPALELRKFNPETRKYTPDANNHKLMIYRAPAQHLSKTTGRRPGAERTVTTKGSDNWLAAKFRRLEGPKRKKQSIPQRKNPWPKSSNRSKFHQR